MSDIPKRIQRKRMKDYRMPESPAYKTIPKATESTTSQKRSHR